MKTSRKFGMKRGRNESITPVGRLAIIVTIVSVTRTGVHIWMIKKNRINLYKSQYDAVLSQDAELMKQFPSIRVRIEGNCDERGTQEYNLALGERRARAVYDYFVAHGVNPGQLEMISYGKENPAVLGTGEAVWAKNRRDDFRVISE